MNVFSIRANMSALVREDVLEGVPCFVCPVVMMVEGVHNGSGGPIFYSTKELASFPSAWDHKPVVLRHPDNEMGMPTSACSVEVLNASKVGTLFNTVWENGKLKSEAWLPKDRLAEMAPEILAELLVGNMVEVSVGLFLEEESTPGVWEGEAFSGEAKNIVPDHLAILVGEIGACSVADGAGLPRVNARSQSVLKRVMLSRLRHRAGEMVQNEQSFGIIMDRIADALVKEMGTDVFVWIEDVYADRVVYSKSGVGVSNSLWMRGYTVQEPAEVVLADVSTVQEVQRVTDYVITMATNALEQEGKQAMVEVLKGAGAVVDPSGRTDGSKFVETLGERVEARMDGIRDRTADDLVGKMFAPGEPAGVVDNAQGSPSSEDPVTIDAFVETAPEGHRAELQEAVTHLRAERAALATELAANELCDFTQEELAAKPLKELIKLRKLVSKPVGVGDAPELRANYSAGGTGAEGPEEPLVVPSLNPAPEGSGRG